MAAVRFDNVQKHYGAFTAVRELNLNVAEGELIALVGPSGCGKSTSLRMLAGFVTVSSGRMYLGDRDVTHQPAHHRSTGMVFQGYALFPHMTVEQNVAFGLQMRKTTTAETSRRVDEALELVRLAQFKTRYPRQLSGGQQQRVALARAIVIRPEVLLLDEPLSALDAKLRLEVREEIRALQRSLGLTTIFVTHDQEEALSMADRLVVMSAGQIEQVGTPEQLYRSPASRFVAEFMGKSNFVEGTIARPGILHSAKGTAFMYRATGDAVTGRATLCIRPEDIELSTQSSDAPNTFPGRVISSSFLGSTMEYRVQLDDGTIVLVEAQASQAQLGQLHALSANVSVALPPDACRVLPVQ